MIHTASDHDGAEARTDGASGPSVLVCQRGNRHRYAIPRLFHEAGMLAALYTDSTALSPMGRMAAFLEHRNLAPNKVRALSARRPQGIPPGKIHSSDRLVYTALFGRRLGGDLSPAYIRRGLQGADWIYSMYGEEFGFLEWAKSRGCHIAVDVFIHPDTLRIVDAEAAHFPGSRRFPQSLIEGHRAHSRRTFEIADLLVCPSEWVASGVCSMFPESAGKVRVVPYGSSVERARAITTDPEPGRILFAGREALRKGLHHLAEAASIVRAAGQSIDVRVAGVDRHQMAWAEHADELNCLGTLPMDRMKKEFRQADVFVLPSLAEGQAGVILEAMACGCPVIATRESGVDFRDGCGVTVPACNAAALADAVLGVISDRSRRNGLAEGALQQSMDYSLERWKSRLVEAISEVPNACE